MLTNAELKRIRQQWLDDHLDLLLYAQRIGDTQWQEEIKAQLLLAEQEIALACFQASWQALQHRYDELTHSLLELHAKLKREEDPYRIVHLRHELIGLKAKRLQLGKLLFT